MDSWKLYHFVIKQICKKRKKSNYNLLWNSFYCWLSFYYWIIKKHFSIKILLFWRWSRRINSFAWGSINKSHKQNDEKVQYHGHILSYDQWNESVFCVNFQPSMFCLLNNSHFWWLTEIWSFNDAEILFWK
jgi:hypothetical protein